MKVLRTPRQWSYIDPSPIPTLPVGQYFKALADHDRRPRRKQKAEVPEVPAPEPVAVLLEPVTRLV